MKKISGSIVVVTAVLTNMVAGQDAADDWRAWRGPYGNGIAENQQPPTAWSETENVRWKAEIPGQGHASPAVVGKQIVLATADVSSEWQSVVSYDFESGRKLWETKVFEGNFNPKIYPTNTHASSTVVSDGKRLFAVFDNDRAASVAALDLDGNVLWTRKAAPFVPKMYQFGFGASPVVHGDRLIVSSECEQEGAIVALSVDDGREIWRIDRPRATSYSTPSIATIAGRRQMIISGGKKVESYDPEDGSLLWSVDAPWIVTCGTPVWDEHCVYVSGGYPTGRTLAVRADGSGEVIWENTNNCYEQSMLLYNGYLYGTTESGLAFCYQASDGKEMWKQRMDRKISASPVLAGGNLYVAAENGITWVFRADPARYDEVARNQLGDSVYATPAFVRNRIVARIARGTGNDRKEILYCIGAE
jgi:outer membrane protein assembly factor BamB